MPVHIHVAEQTREVEECLAGHGRRPVEWLLEKVAVDARWCLVHATHADAGETRAHRQAERRRRPVPDHRGQPRRRHLPRPSFLAQGGRFGIGSDSNVRISAAEELRTLEYGQRLMHRQRNVLGEARARPAAACSTPRWPAARRPSGGPSGALAPGKRADFVVLEADGLRDDYVVDAWLFSSDNSAIKSVYCGGVPVVQNGRHIARDAIVNRFHRVQR